MAGTSARNHRIRFMQNNFAELITSSITFSSELASFPGSNSINRFRSRVWKPSGYFKVTAATDDKLYINDGTDKTVTITAGEYTTPALLATQIQADLNAASANWTVSYDSAGSTYKFTISNSGSVTLRYSQATEAIWDKLGYVGSADTTGTSFEADQQRNHDEEFAIFDLGYNASMTFFAAIGPLNEVFSISSSATIQLIANNLNDFENSPPLTVTLSRSNGGLLEFMDTLADTGYRFWKFKIVDKFNPTGPDGLSIGHVYLGDYTTISNRNINSGFSKQQFDPSVTSISESGALFFDSKTKYAKFGNMSVRYLEQADKDTLESMYQVLGKITPFYVSFDPTLGTTLTLDELTRYCVFEEAPIFTHVKASVYSMSLKFREVF